MKIAERQRNERRLFQRLAADIIQGIADGEAPVTMSERILSGIPDGERDAAGLDQRIVYRWIQGLENRLDAVRRRLAIVGVSILWTGVLFLVLALIAIFMNGRSIAEPLVVAPGVAGLFLAGWGVYRLVTLRARVPRLVLEEAGAEDAAAP